tara:strand:+ start:176 stop:916 length:741 start_codon:yes stop_codon:yes gene_type:complete
MIRLKNILSEKILKEAPGDPPWKPEEEPEVVENPSSVYSGLNDVMLDAYVITYDQKTGETTSGVATGEYVGGMARRRKRLNWWKVKGINTTGLNNKIRKFASHYVKWMGANINQEVGPVVTSGYRGPKRQINAMYTQWSKNNDYITKTYRRGDGLELGGTVDKIFNKYPEQEAKNRAISYLTRQETLGKYISNHQVKGAIDIALFINSSENDQIKAFLDHAKSKGIIKKYLDERDMPAPHFHINLV